MLNVAILGCGAIARKRHAPAISRFEGASLYAVYDPDEERAGALAREYRTRACTDLDILLGDPRLTAVSICAPERFHRDLTVKCLAAGKDVLLEKPMAMTVDEAECIMAAQKKTGKHLQIAFSQRCYPEYVLVKKMLRDELIGRPLSFRTILANSGVEYTVAQQALGDFYDRNLKNTGGVMLNVGCHRVDLMRFIFDSDFSRVLAFTPTTDKRFADGGLIDREDTAMISAEMKNGVNGSFWITWCNYGPARAEAEFFGSAGFIRAGAEGVDLWRGQECTHYSIPAEERDPHGFKIVENFLDVLVNGAVPVDSAVDGLECMRVLKAVEESNRKGGWAFL